jgi:thioredoxin 2
MATTNDKLLVPCPHCDTLNRVARAKLGQGGRCGECHRLLFTGHPVALDKARFERHLDKGDLPLLIDFWAPWCGPCRAMGPQFERAARDLEPQMRLVKINVDEEPELAQRFAVSSIPMIALAWHGRELGRIAGAMPAEQLERWARDRVGA